MDCPKTTGKVRVPRPSGEVIFTLLPHPQGGAAFMVLDHFHSPSPLPVDKMAVLISSYASTHRSGDAVQQILHDGENYERFVYGLGKSGRIIAKLAGTSHPGVEEEADDRFKMEQLISIPQPLLKRIASFRLVARPYQWTQFKNVALQPGK